MPAALAPDLVAALYELEVLERRDRPMLAAQWVAQGLGGDRTAELAGLHGHEPEVTDLWPLALGELGVSLPVHRARRTALPWLAERLSSEQEDLSWLLRVLWPEHAGDNDVDEVLDQVIYTIDGHLDFIGALGESQLVRPVRARGRRRDGGLVDRLQVEVAAAYQCLLQGDIEAAAAALRLP